MSLDDEEHRVLKILVKRAVAANDRRLRAKEELAAAGERVADANLALDRCRQAFSAFGFNVSDTGFWEQVRDTIGDAAWLEAHAVSADSSPNKAVLPEGSLLDPPFLQDFVRAELQAAGGRGATVAHLRTVYEDRYLRSIAPQSVMSALYKVARLLRRGQRGGWYGLP